ncbi:MAG TPA: DinB family protein [Salegentibacter sp.]|uniref:DinB family protein n=1 Tax=Salegentibacter sp. TaxID=1903072 RepID=UPI002F938671
MECNANANQLAEFSWEIRDKSLDILENLPEGFENWRLNNNAMSFAHIAKHLVRIDERFLEMLQTGNKTFKWHMGSEEPHYRIEKAEFEDIKERLKTLQKKRHAVIQAMDEKTLNEKVSGELGKQSNIWWFIMEKLLEHEIYHRGQLGAYLKIIQGEQE